jgi:hypothetical protein
MLNATSLSEPACRPQASDPAHRKVVIAPRNVQADEDHAADAPADVLTEFSVQRIVALTCELQGVVSKADVPLGKDVAEFRQACAGVRASPVTICAL